jgi:hypothetical protein
MLTRCLRVEIIKPLGDDTWDSIGPHMHALRQSMSILLTEGIVECLTHPELAPQSAARQGIARGLDELRSYHAKRLKSKGLDTDKRAWSVRLASLDVNSYIVDAMTGMVKGPFGKWRAARFRGGERVPSFTAELIPLRDRGWALTSDTRGYVLRTKLDSRRGAYTHFAVKIDGPGAHALARVIARGGVEVSQGDCKLVYDRKHKRWSARLAVSYPAPVVPALDATRVLCVHRGIRRFITWATSEGDTGVIDNGAAIVQFKDKIHRRRRWYYSFKKTLPPSKRGRGWYRRYDYYRALEVREQDFVATHCKQTAAAIIKAARRRGCGTILLDDWSARQLADDIEVRAKDEGFWATFVRNWPFAQMRDAVVVAAQSAGMTVKAIAVPYESLRCPHCGVVDTRNDRGRGRFCCVHDSFERDMDTVANLNVLAAAGYMGVLGKQKAQVNAALAAPSGKSGRPVKP